MHTSNVSTMLGNLEAQDNLAFQDNLTTRKKATISEQNNSRL